MLDVTGICTFREWLGAVWHGCKQQWGRTLKLDSCIWKRHEERLLGHTSKERPREGGISQNMGRRLLSLLHSRKLSFDTFLKWTWCVEGMGGNFKAKVREHRVAAELGSSHFQEYL